MDGCFLPQGGEGGSGVEEDGSEERVEDVVELWRGGKVWGYLLIWGRAWALTVTKELNTVTACFVFRGGVASVAL